MSLHARERLLWGLVGGLSFLVLTLAYELAMSPGIDVVVMAGGTVVVGVISTVAVSLLHRRLPQRGDGP